MSDALIMGIVTAVTTIALAYISALTKRPDWSTPRVAHPQATRASRVYVPPDSEKTV